MTARTPTTGRAPRRPATTRQAGVSAADGRVHLVVTGKDGYAQVEQSALADSNSVDLQAWGRIEGTVTLDDKPAADVTVAIDLQRPNQNMPCACRSARSVSSQHQHEDRRERASSPSRTSRPATPKSADANTSPSPANPTRSPIETRSLKTSRSTPAKPPRSISAVTRTRRIEFFCFRRTSDTQTKQVHRCVPRLHRTTLSPERIASPIRAVITELR